MRRPGPAHGARLELNLPLPPPAAWRILVDFDAYPEWIPTFVLVGVPELGAKVTYRLRNRTGRISSIPAVVIDFAPDRRLEISARFGPLLTIHQRFELAAKGTGAAFVHEMAVSGLLGRLLPGARMRSNLSRLAEAFNRKYQAHCATVALPGSRVRR